MSTLKASYGHGQSPCKDSLSIYDQTHWPLEGRQDWGWPCQPSFQKCLLLGLAAPVGNTTLWVPVTALVWVLAHN